MTVQWATEGCDRYDDPISGARIVQLTSGAHVSNNIYCEQPYTSPDGNRIAILRKGDFSFDPAASLLVGDLARLRVGLIERDCVTSACNAAWSGLLHYFTTDHRLVRLNLETLEQTVINLDGDEHLPRGGSSVSPDQRYIIHPDTSDGEQVRIMRFDVQSRTVEPIFAHPEITNPHLQFNPVHGRDILVQHNRGTRIGRAGEIRQTVTEQGTTLFVIDRDGKNQRPLPVGPPITAGATGHECFVAGTGRVAFTTAWNHHDWSLDERFPTGNLFTAAPGDAKPTVFEAPDCRFNHLCVSRCGRYFVADSYPADGLFTNGVLNSVSLVVGNLKTGKYRTLVSDTLASGGGNQSTHTHPYLTADNRHVIFNSDPHYSVPQVFAAKLPDDFLDSLD